MIARQLFAALALAAATACTGETAPAAATPDAAPSGPIVGVGTIIALEREKREVTLDHEPIEAIGWSAMTMRFNAADSVDLTAIAVGDSVSFELASAKDARTLVRVEKR